MLIFQVFGQNVTGLNTFNSNQATINEATTQTNQGKTREDYNRDVSAAQKDLKTNYPLTQYTRETARLGDDILKQLSQKGEISTELQGQIDEYLKRISGIYLQNKGMAAVNDAILALEVKNGKPVNVSPDIIWKPQYILNLIKNLGETEASALLVAKAVGIPDKLALEGTDGLKG
jgi:hypothetical protein